MRLGESERDGSFPPLMSAARSGLMSSCLSELTRGNLSGLIEGPRSADAAEDLGGGIVSRDKRPLVSPRALLASLSAFSRGESAVHRGGGSGRTRSRAATGSRSGARPKSLGPGSRRSLLGNSRGLSPGLSSRFGSCKRESLPSLSLLSLPSLRSPCRGGWCLSNMRCEGIGASGRLGRVEDRSGKEVGATFLDDSARPVMLVDVAAAFASCFSRKCCSLRSKTSDFRGSLAVGAGVEGLDSAVVSTGVPDFDVLAFVALTDALASSTSPSSTSAVVGALGVDTPRELT